MPNKSIDPRKTINLLHVLCDNNSQRAGVVAVQPGAVLMQDGAEEL